MYCCALFRGLIEISCTPRSTSQLLYCGHRVPGNPWDCSNKRSFYAVARFSHPSWRIYVPFDINILEPHTHGLPSITSIDTHWRLSLSPRTIRRQFLQTQHCFTIIFNSQTNTKLRVGYCVRDIQLVEPQQRTGGVYACMKCEVLWNDNMFHKSLWCVHDAVLSGLKHSLGMGMEVVNFKFQMYVLLIMCVCQCSNSYNPIYVQQNNWTFRQWLK